MKAIKLTLLLISFSTFGMYSQNVMTSSPYSMFGIGETDAGMYGANSAMGGVSVGMRGTRLINTANPASLTALDSCRLIADVSAFGKFESYHSKGADNNAFTGNLARFAMAGRIIPRWYAAVGVAPYSSVGYYFKTLQSLEGSPDSYYYSTFTGDGGLSKVYMSNAFKITPALSVGANVDFIFGNITQSEEQSTMSVSEKMFGTTISGSLGMQYHKQLSRESSLTLGATYGFKQKIYMERTKTVAESSTSTVSKMKKANQTLPQSIGIGASYVNKKMTYGLDYLFKQYGQLTSSDSRVTFHDSHEIRAGISYLPTIFSSSNFWKRTEYKFGIDISTPSMHLYQKKGYSYRINGGLGFPVNNGRINTAIFYDRLKLEGNTLDRSITGITVTYTISELFYKIKL